MGVHVLSHRDRFPTREVHVSSALGKHSLSDTDYSFKQSINAPKPNACAFGVKPQTLVLMADLTWRQRPDSVLEIGLWDSTKNLVRADIADIGWRRSWRLQSARLALSPSAQSLAR